MAPIRVGILGLSDAKHMMRAGAWAVFAHLPALRALPNDYKIVAIANSTVESARRSIAANALPETTKAYGSAEDLARDPDVDLVVVSVNVAKHYMLTKPALLQKKAVYVEWPVGATIAEAEEMTALARENGVRTIVGLQARSDRLVLKVKEILTSGEIGEVVSSTVTASTSYIPLRWLEGLEYYLDMESGGNEFRIMLAHFLDSFTDVLGDFDDVNAIMMNRAKTVPVYNLAGELVNPAHPKSSPDHMLVQGILSSRAVASIIFRKPLSAVDNVGIRWLITGTKGEIEITTPEQQWQMAHPEMKLRVKIGSESDAREVDYRNGAAADDRLSGLDHVALNTAYTYVAFAEDDQTRYATFESALKTHRLLERILANAKWV